MQKQRLLTGIIFGLVMAVLLALVAAGVQAQTGDDANLIALGKAMFFDPNLSINRTESCATCHAPEAGFTGPDSFVNAHGAVYEGALGTRFGNRRPPTSAYAGDSPALHFDAARGLWVGGMFWDGRATGAVLSDPLAEQAQGPFLNPLEQAFPDAKQLVLRVAQSEYADLFKEVWGAGSLDPVKDVTGTYERIARSIAAYERSAEVNPYTSKFDLFWDHAVAAGKDVTKIHWPRMGGGVG
ncbi:MAG: cytochrome-c peroxidase, partial [Anaerolineaceae bacterium]